ncbi:MAG TPA: 5-(carboxyamino)imidazole ribonucleotide synthase [Microbacteriaceae bacterium]|nr:5-(carboxyamino)imidazole ribonucleotide synthase [Microbacteriaceae bacterium]
MTRSTRAPRLGIIGGGQLARMMIAPAVELGVDIRVLAEAEGMSAALATTAVGDYRDAATVLAFAADVDVVSFDHEHVPQDVLEALVAAGHAVHPGPHALAIAQDKLLMRERLSAAGLPVPEWAAVHNTAELEAFLADHAGEAVVKTPRGGYDGKGVRVVSSAAEVADWFALLDPSGPVSALLVEERVPFRRELAQLVARRPSGELAAWPVVETVQSDGICSEVLAPAPHARGRLSEVCADIAERVAAELGVTGVLAVELFETVDDRVLINELAMRPHNSGHWTQDGAVTSQFEQHIRAVLDLPLGAPDPVASATVMVNILGGPEGELLTDRYDRTMRAFPDVKIHGYDKASRPGRKVGHVNAVGDDLDDAAYRARAAAALLRDS